jgi:hypothetical protein
MFGAKEPVKIQNHPKLTLAFVVQNGLDQIVCDRIRNDLSDLSMVWACR